MGERDAAAPLLFSVQKLLRIRMDRYDFIAFVLLTATSSVNASSFSPYPDRMTNPTTWGESLVVNPQYELVKQYPGWSAPRSYIQLSATLSYLKYEKPDGYWDDLNFTCNDNRQTGEIRCDGIYLGVRGKAPESFDVQNVLANYWSSHKVQWRSYGGNNLVSGDYCSLHASVLVLGYGMVTYEDRSCNGGPVSPVQCEVSGPSVLTHPPQEQNSIVSTVRDTWHITCTRPTTVIVSTTRDVKLRSGSDNLDSGLYIESEGVNSMVFTVDTPRSVGILSKLKSSTAPPGSYQGSGIITVSLP